MTMTDQQSLLTELFAACWQDPALKERFMNDPKAVLTEHGIDVPHNMKVHVVENTETTVNITIPKAPEDAMDVSDEELNNTPRVCKKTPTFYGWQCSLIGLTAQRI